MSDEEKKKMDTTKHETILELAHRNPRGEPQFTVQGGPEDLRSTFVALDRTAWEDLGSPETITIAIWPGDQLNSTPYTRATREELDEETQKVYQKFTGHPLGDSDGGDPGGENIAKPE